MSTFLTVLVGLLLAGILFVLGSGIRQMLSGSDPKASNRLMRYRVILQFAVLMLMGLFALIFQK
jgi:Hypoxia induced protein conserved region